MRTTKLKKSKDGHKRLAFYLLIICLALGCKDSHDDQDATKAYDPSRPVTFTEFTPGTGSVRSKFFINGDNFGTDISKIKVSIGGQRAKVVGSNGRQIYCIVPRRAYSGEVKVEILGSDNKVAIEHLFEEQFEYIAKTTVGTLAGKVDPATNTSSMIDGPLSEAQFSDPYWLIFDEDKSGVRYLYLTEVAIALRQIDLTNEYVFTTVSNGQAGLNKLQTNTLDISKDTIFFADDTGQNNKTRPVLSYSVRSEQFKRVYPYLYDRTGYSCAQHPDGTLFYNTYWNAEVKKANAEYNPVSQEWESKSMFYLANGTNAHTYIFMHPTGEYAYITGATYCCIYKSKYDPVLKELTSPIIFAGGLKSNGYVDAPSTQARFSTPIRQGTFALNKTYVEEGRDDVYDFYLCDTNNHCIRKITPDGEVSTFAGRGTQTASSTTVHSGYADGDPRLEARFKNPSGIAYDEATETFYIADRDNKRIRYITVE